jgi:hypothetical protein
MNTALNQLMDTIDAAGLDTPDDFAADASVLLALAIAKLPPDEREHVLRAIESGLLRQDVTKFEARRQPYPRLVQ